MINFKDQIIRKEYMIFFETLAGIGFIGLSISFATVMYLESGESIESQIASAFTIIFLIILIVGIVGYFFYVFI